VAAVQIITLAFGDEIVECCRYSNVSANFAVGHTMFKVNVFWGFRKPYIHVVFDVSENITGTIFRMIVFCLVYKFSDVSENMTVTVFRVNLFRGLGSFIYAQSRRFGKEVPSSG
jgi:hypothetical protein